MLTFGFEAMISVKNLKAKKVIFVYFYDVKSGNFCSCPNSKGNILQKALFSFAFIGYPNLNHILLNALN